jgi:hypothetical protein
VTDDGDGPDIFGFEPEKCLVVRPSFVWRGWGLSGGPTMRRLLLAGTLMALTGCGYYDARQARDPLGAHSLIGMTVPDLIDCMGKPDLVQQTGPDTAILEYVHTDSSAGLKATLSLVGSVSIGGGGGCRAVFTVLREGMAADVAFPGSYNDGLLSTPYESCSPLVSECLCASREHRAAGRI